MNLPIIDCKIGDIIQYVYQGSPRRYLKSVLAIIVGEKRFRLGQHKWLIQPLGVEDTRQYHIPATSIVWEKLIQTP